MPLKGIRRVKANYAAKVKEISTTRTEAAMFAILSQGAAIAQTMTPMDTGTLANTQYAPYIKVTSGNAVGYVGYTAEYAGWVHRKPGTLIGEPRANGNDTYWHPNAEPEWLTKGFDELKPSINSILKSYYRV